MCHLPRLAGIAAQVFALVAAASFTVSPVAAQERPARSETVAGAETAARDSRRPATAVATGDTDEPGRGDATNTQPAGDPRAARAREAKLGDSDVATAPIRELRVAEPPFGDDRRPRGAVHRDRGKR